ncbi:MAG: TldD/PmbA family protein [Gemmatimonadales bacterium]
MKRRLEAAVAGVRAAYGELRVRRIWTSIVRVRDRTVEVARTDERAGGVARTVSPDTGWGITGFTGTDRLDEHLARAADLASAGGAHARRPVQLATIPIRQLEQAESPAGDPRDVSLAAKQEVAERLAARLRAVDRRIVGGRVTCRDEVVETWLATSEGTWLHELRCETSLAALAVAEESGNVEWALGSFGSRDWPSLAEAVETVAGTANRALDRLHAAPVRAGRYTVVLDPAAAGLMAHRLVSHLGRTPLSGADPDALPIGLRVGPESLTIGDDPTAAGLRGTLTLDDEGTPARRAVLVQNGVVTGHLTTRETAMRTRQSPSGHARAGTLSAAPAPRAANSFVAPGQGKLEDLLSGVDRGVYIADLLAAEQGSGQLTLRAAAARMIRNGRLAEPVKGVQLDGSLLALLGRLDAVAGDFTWSPAAARCRDGAGGAVAVSLGAPHLRLVDVPVTEGMP